VCAMRRERKRILLVFVLVILGVEGGWEHINNDFT